MNYLKQLPIQLIISIVLAFILGHVTNLYFVSIFYTISTCFIELLIFVLPFMIFSFIFRALVNSKRGSLLLLLCIFAGVTISNCLALTTAYFFGSAFLPFLGLEHSPEVTQTFVSQVPQLFKLSLPTLLGTEKAMLIGLGLGVAISFLKDSYTVKIISQRVANEFTRIIILFLQRIFLPLLPLYVFGFCLKLSFDNGLIQLFQQFGKVFILSMALVSLYIFFLYFIGAGGNFKQAKLNIANMLPAGLTGFSTMSSAATMPVTLTCTEKNTKNGQFTDLIIPSTANIHMLGDDLTIVITSLSLLSIFGMAWPEPLAIFPFVLAFSLAKLSCVGVPGASVLVILPVLETHLGFTSEMISVLTTIYILQDPFGTAANVMGNGAFALIIQRLFKLNLKTAIARDR